MKVVPVALTGSSTIAYCTKITAMTVAMLTEKGNNRFIGRWRKKLRMKDRCSGMNSSLRFRTPRNTLNFELSRIHHSTMNVQVPT